MRNRKPTFTRGCPVPNRDGTNIASARPGATSTEVHRAIAETKGASGAATRLLGRLTSFPTRNCAGLGEGGYQP